MEHFDALNQYINFLWTQMQYDWSVFTNPWILYTVIPALAYFLFFILKWYVLLAPITIPITTYTHGMGRVAEISAGKEAGATKEITKLLKG
jgi:hypothetical protein